MGQALDDLTAPPLLGLVVEDAPADLPVEPEQFGVDRQRGALLGGVDATFEVGQPAGVPLRRVGERGHLVGHVTSLPAPSDNSRIDLQAASASPRHPSGQMWPRLRTARCVVPSRMRRSAERVLRVGDHRIGL
jgi:hypothetical protein